jgi:hypothetical protein
MPLQNWEGLQKNTTDAETIEQAIARLIGVHEVDSTAHLGAGESLQSHKSEEVIDHPAFSLVADKFSPQLPLFQTLFESISSWITDGFVASGLCRLEPLMYGDSASDIYAYQEAISFRWDDVLNEAVESMYQTKFKYNYNVDIANFIFGMGVSDSFTPSDHFIGWKIVAGVIYSGFQLEDTLVWVSHGAISQSNYYTVSVIISRSNQTVEYFLNGVSVRTVDLSSYVERWFATWGVYADKKGGTTNAQFSSLDFKFLQWSTESV